MTVTVNTQTKPFVLLTPGYYPARTGDQFQIICTPEDVAPVVELLSASRYVAVDLETQGTDYSAPGPLNRIVGMGLAWDTGSCYFDWAHLPQRHRDQLLHCLLQHKGLLAHNVYFDGGFLFVEAGYRHMDWHRCTYGLYMQLANEGWTGQRWGLKEAETDLLGWEETNDRELIEWLITNQYVTSKDRADKGAMWRAPAEILGKYCILDAEATYLLYTCILEPVERKFPDLQQYHYQDFLYLVRLLIEQHIHGIQVDVPRMRKYREELTAQTVRLTAEFRALPEVAAEIAVYEQARVQEYLEREPPRYRKAPNIGDAPPMYKKNGKLNPSWTKWNERRLAPPVESKNWIKWKQKLDEIRSGKHEAYMFNLRSGDQLRWLLFERLEYEPVKQTETGLPAVDGDSMRTFGTPGRLLTQLSEAEKELSYIDAYLEDMERNGRDTLHPGWKAPGTVTGRLAGKDPNIQQMPKTVGTMSCLVSRPGTVWVDLDFAALEPYVAAELSRDPAMLRLYGPGSKPTDLYLFVGANIGGSISAAIRAAGFDPENPTPEGVAAAKKKCKRERGICKQVCLGANYGAGAQKLHSTLLIGGVDISLEEVQEIHHSYWQLFAGLRTYSNQLQKEWLHRKGWVLNALGRPMCVDGDKVRDCLNRVVQSTGHDLLMQYIRIFTTRLTEEGIPWIPIIIDLHDASTVEVPEQYEQRTIEIMNESVGLLNRTFGPDVVVHLKGEAEAGRNLADVKKPEN